MRIRVRHKLGLLMLFLVFVILPPSLVMMSVLERKLWALSGTQCSGFLRDPAGMIFLFWFSIPGSIIGEPAFIERPFYGVMAPSGFVGWILTVLFWIAISLCVWTTTLIFRRKNIHIAESLEDAEQDAQMATPTNPSD